MARLPKVYRRLWGLSGNPFPDHAIASAGDRQQPFYEHLHPGIGSKMARAFLGVNGLAPKVAFLWSLGHGEEARGYGKTRHLLWFASRVNHDLGLSAARSAGRTNNAEISLAAYASFSTIEGLSLSNLLFDVARDLARSQGDKLVSLRDAEFKKGRTSDDIYESAEKRIRKAGEDWSPGLLTYLSSCEPKDWLEYLDGFSQWHKVRYGRQMLRALIAFLRELGIERLLVLVDQVEDFASYITPAYKLQRDFQRLAYLCSADSLLSAHVTFVLTMHPRAARILSSYWPESELGPVTADGTAENVVLLGAMSTSRFVALVKAYLDSVRIEPSRDPLRPFNEETIDFVHKCERGRPGHCLQRLYFLLDLAAAEGVENIETQFVERSLAEASDRG
jgi:hypothetical protein